VVGASADFGSLQPYPRGSGDASHHTSSNREIQSHPRTTNSLRNFQLESGIVGAFKKRRIVLVSLCGVLLQRPSVSLAMFSRAIQQYSSQQKPVEKSSQPAIQRTLEFGGAKRKADVMEGSNKRTALDTTSLLATRLSITPEKGIGLIQAVTQTDSFSEKKGQIMLGGEVFNEADFDDFDDIEIDDWDVCQSTVAVETNRVVNNNSAVAEDEDDYFKDDDDSDRDAPLQTVNVVNQDPTAKSTLPIQVQVVENNKENSLPAEPLQTTPPPELLAKVLFPSSAPLPWSSSPPNESKPPPKRSLPWVTNPEHYTPKFKEPTYKPEKSKLISIIHGQGARRISTMGMEQTKDLEVLGLTQEDIFTQQKRKRMEELQLEKANEELQRGMEWLNQGPSTMTRRRNKTEDKPQLSKIAGDKNTLAAVFLSQEQLTVRKLVIEDIQSVFFTGSAGICPMWND
jgi:hypothetical protein